MLECCCDKKESCSLLFLFSSSMSALPVHDATPFPTTWVYTKTNNYTISTTNIFVVTQSNPPTNTANMAPPRHGQVEIDLDDDDLSGSSTYQTDEAPYVFRRSFPSIPTNSQSRKRHATDLDLDSAPSSPSETPQAGPSVKRLRRPGERVRPPKATPHSSAGGTNTPAAIEAIDLTEEATPLKETLQKQREDQIKAQREDAGKPLLLTKMTCVVCMDTPTDLTATKCGMSSPSYSPHYNQISLTSY